MAGTLHHGWEGLDAVADKRRPDGSRLFGDCFIEPNPDGTVVDFQRDDMLSSGFDAGRDVDCKFLSLEGWLEVAASDKEPPPTVVISALGQILAGSERLAKPVPQAGRNKSKSPSFLGHLFFFASSAITALVADVAIFKIAGVDILALPGPFGSRSALQAILGVLALSSTVLATCTYSRANHPLTQSQSRFFGPRSP